MTANGQFPRKCPLRLTNGQRRFVVCTSLNMQRGSEDCHEWQPLHGDACSIGLAHAEARSALPTGQPGLIDRRMQFASCGWPHHSGFPCIGVDLLRRRMTRESRPCQSVVRIRLHPSEGAAKSVGTAIELVGMNPTVLTESF